MNMYSRTEILKPSDVQPAWSRPPSLMAHIAAWGAFAVTVPSAVWRVLMIMGFLPGTADLRMAHAGDELYVWGLSLVQLAAGFLAIGLIRPWGERIGGLKIPHWIPIGFGIIGGCAVTYLFTIASLVGLASGSRPDQGLVHGDALVIMVLCYAPIIFWGPLELVAVFAFIRRVNGAAHRSISY